MTEKTIDPKSMNPQEIKDKRSELEKELEELRRYNAQSIKLNSWMAAIVGLPALGFLFWTDWKLAVVMLLLFFAQNLSQRAEHLRLLS